MSQYASEETRVKDIISKQLGVPVEELHPNRKFNDLGASTLDHVTMSMEIEKAFGIKISLEDSMRLDTVQRLVSHVIVMTHPALKWSTNESSESRT